jgi:hypothetical protein
VKPSAFSSHARCILAALAIAGCSDRPQPTEPTSLPRGAEPLFAGAKAELRSRANLVFANEVTVGGVAQAAGIRGDERLKDGSAAGPGAPTEYQARHCGVIAWIANGRNESGSLTFDPDSDYSDSMEADCGPARFYNFYLGGPTAAPTPATPMSYSRAIWSLGPGESHSIYEGFGPVGPCDLLQFNYAYPPSNNVLVTRLPDVQVQNASGATVTARQWRIESQGSHRAACLTYSKNGTPQYSGVTYYLPFAITVTEMPYPYTSFP